jgi:predicted metal-dependent HD superfamily phosphohydrolase
MRMPTYAPFNRWSDLWTRLGARGNKVGVYAKLMARYDAPHRTYHTFPHIEHCLDELDEARHLASQPDEVEFALWFHDAVYNPRAKDNEERSAAWAYNAITGSAGLPDDIGRRVHDLILATKHHAPADADAKLLTDIDLAILGRPREEFDAYDAAIREEYSWVPEDRYRQKRAEILRGFLDRTSIYATDHFRNRYGRSARENLVRAIARLS